MGSWKQSHPRQLKKIVYGLTDSAIKKVIEEHESRGWEQASEIKDYNYGLGCLMKWRTETNV